MGGIIQRRLLTAEHHQRVMLARLRQPPVLPGFVKVDPRRRLMQGDADLSVMGDAGVFDDGNAHGGIGSRGLLPQRKHAPAITARREGAV